MGFMVNMMRDSAEAGGRDRYACSAAAWELLLEIGKAFGWKPLGTSYVPANVRTAAEGAPRHGYKPGDPKDHKGIEADDAQAWARALSEARRSPHLAQMIGARPEPIVLPQDASTEEVQSANAPFSAIMDEFIEYAFGGAFSFALAE